MAVITPGSGATITASSIEAFFPGIIWLLQNLEADTLKNPSGANNVTSSISDDSRSLNATLTFLATVDDDASGKCLLTCLDYLTQPSGQSAYWNPGSGGTITGQTIQTAGFEAARLIDKLENTAANNPTGRKTTSWSVTSAGGGDGTSPYATVNINVTGFPLTFSFNANGTQSLVGSVYLT